MREKRVVLPGGAGLVGQNLVARLRERGYSNIVVLDKHRANLETLRKLQPEITVEYADLAVAGSWQRHVETADVVVMLQAQIGGNDYQQFMRNNLDSTRHVLDAIHAATAAPELPYLVHVSSSVVESAAEDFYTETKKAQERLILESGVPCPILRPTLMFGWFDRKHLGWLSRFMKKSPVFPLPGLGRYPRQPLYAGDFSNIIISCIENRIRDGVYTIAGHEKIDYVDIIREIRQATNTRTLILPVPYSVFHSLLWTWALFDRNPPFTTQQLAALAAGDEFVVSDWPTTFKVSCTPFRQAVDETFNDSRFSGTTLEF